MSDRKESPTREPRYVTAQQASVLYGVSTKALRDAVKAGRLRTKRSGKSGRGRYLFTITWLEAWIGPPKAPGSRASNAFGAGHLTLAAVAYNKAGAAAATGISEAVITTAVDKDELIAHYVGTKPLFRAVDLDEWVDSLPGERGGSVSKRRRTSGLALSAVSYNMAGAVAATGISETTIELAIANYELAARYNGSRRIFRAVELDAWIEALPTESSRPRAVQLFDMDSLRR